MPSKSTDRQLDEDARSALLDTLRKRFEQNAPRHPDIEWSEVLERLGSAPDKLWSLAELERTGGEPDVAGRDEETGGFVFFDCSPESPKGRRSVCYDREALEARKKHKPKTSAVAMADAMGATLLDEEQYRHLQSLGPFDAKTSSWLKTPTAIRELGGAIFGDYRFATVFIYHNGADSYYGARGFRCSLTV